MLLWQFLLWQYYYCSYNNCSFNNYSYNNCSNDNFSYDNTIIIAHMTIAPMTIAPLTMTMRWSGIKILHPDYLKLYIPGKQLQLVVKRAQLHFTHVIGKKPLTFRNSTSKLSHVVNNRSQSDSNIRWPEKVFFFITF